MSKTVYEVRTELFYPEGHPFREQYEGSCSAETLEHLCHKEQVDCLVTSGLEEACAAVVRHYKATGVVASIFMVKKFADVTIEV